MTHSDTILARLLELHPKRIDLSLGRVQRLAAKLGNPERHLPPIVHVAGTNGKGSLIAFMAAILHAAGYEVAAYTSPHLCDFAERISFNGTPISEPDLARHLATCETTNAGTPITFFEITTMAAFLAFAERRPDIILLEVGLGGEFDATNIITPCLSVITPISMDHEDFLGSTITDIARAKAGIIKPHTPVVAMPDDPSATEVIIQTAKRHNATCHLYGRDFHLAETLPTLSLTGDHQRHNASLAIYATEQLRLQGFTIPDEAIQHGLTHAEWAGRLQRLHLAELPDWEVLLDGGHNCAAAKVLATHAQNLGELTIIMGMQNNKDAKSFLQILKPHISHLFAVPITSSENAFTPDELTKIATEQNILATSCDSFSTALSHLLNRPAGRLLICGSLYLAGEVLNACKTA